MKRFVKFECLENWKHGLFSWWNLHQIDIFAPGGNLCRPKSIISAKIHVKLILTHTTLAKALQQPILGANAL